VAAAARLAHSEHRFRGAFDNAPLDLALVDSDNRYVRANHALCPMQDVPDAELVGLNQDLFGLDADNAIEHTFQQDLLAGRRDTVQYERRYRTREGNTLWALVSATLLPSNQEPQHFLVQINDVTELADTEGVRATMTALKGLGVLVAIDDFGTGYSSLSFISRLRPDELKVNKSLVSDVDTNAERAGLVVAALAMARSLHLMVVAEGVETEAEQAFLQAHGCDMAQGYLHARPIPASEFESWMALGRGARSEPAPGYR
jgi:PAS domain S-box-containing protein